MISVKDGARWIGSTLFLLAITACSSPTIHGFTITSGPVSISIPAGGAASLTVEAVATSSEPVTAAVVLYNLPIGVTASPTSPTVTTGSQTTITLSAEENAPTATNQVQVTGYAGLANSTSIVSVAVVPAS